MKARGKAEVQLYSFFNLGARRGWVVNATPQTFYPWGRHPVPTVQEAGRAPATVWTGAENLAGTGIRFMDRTAHRKSQYGLLLLLLLIIIIIIIIIIMSAKLNFSYLTCAL